MAFFVCTNVDEMWMYFKQNPNTFAASLVPDVKSGLKGNPVKIGSYPRSCKGLLHFL
jgi:hypothetical protein